LLTPWRATCWASSLPETIGDTFVNLQIFGKISEFGLIFSR